MAVRQNGVLMFRLTPQRLNRADHRGKRAMAWCTAEAVGCLHEVEGTGWLRAVDRDASVDQGDNVLQRVAAFAQVPSRAPMKYCGSAG